MRTRCPRSITFLTVPLLVLAGCAATPATDQSPGTVELNPDEGSQATDSPPMDSLSDAMRKFQDDRGYAAPESVPEGDGLSHRVKPNFNDIGSPVQPAASNTASSASDWRDSPFGKEKTAARDWLDETDREQTRKTDADRTANERDADPAKPDVNATAERAISPEVATPPTETGDERLAVLLVDLQRELFTRSTWSDQPMREVLGLAMLSLLDSDVVLTPDSLRDLTDEEQQKALALNRAFRELGQRLNDDADAIESLIDIIEALRTDLVDLPDLQIPTAALCWKVERFGAYREFAPYAFLADKGQEMVIYLEVEGFTSLRQATSDWTTELSQQLRIYDDTSGLMVWETPWQRVSDVSTRERNDFFTTQNIRLPRRLSVGIYNLKISMRDEQSGAETERALTFKVVAQEAMAAKMQ